MRPFISLSAAITLAALVLTVCLAGRGSEAANTARQSSRGAGQEQQQQGDGVRRVTVAELREALEKGTAVVIDVRSEDTYKAGHIKGARWIPLDEIASRVKELPRDKTIVTYCS